MGSLATCCAIPSEVYDERPGWHFPFDSVFTGRGSSISLGVHRFDAAQQDLHVRHAAFSLVAKHRFAIDQDSHVAGLSRPYLRFDSEFFFCCLLQAHGCTAQIHSKETTVDFDVHARPRDPILEFNYKAMPVCLKVKARALFSNCELPISNCCSCTYQISREIAVYHFFANNKESRA